MTETNELDILKLELKKLKEEREICRGEFEGDLDGEPVPGTVFDGTDAACPGWWRGQDDGVRGACQGLLKLFRPEGYKSGWGSVYMKEVETEVKKLQDLVKSNSNKPGEIKMENTYIQEENKRLTEDNKEHLEILEELRKCIQQCIDGLIIHRELYQSIRDRIGYQQDKKSALICYQEWKKEKKG